MSRRWWMGRRPGWAACKDPVTPDDDHADTTTQDVRPGRQEPTSDTRAHPVPPSDGDGERHRRLRQFSMLDTADPEVELMRADRDKALAIFERKLADLVGARLRAVMRKVLADVDPALVAAGDLSALSAITNLWGDEVDGDVSDAVLEMFVTAGMATWMDSPDEYAAAVDSIGVLDPILNEQAVSYMATATNRMLDVGNTAWAQARSELEAGMRAGESIDEMRDRVAHVLDVNEVRARTIARTEAVGASNAGSMAGSRSLGNFGPSHKQWLASSDSRVRESHAEADGQVVAMDDYFDVGGASLDYPGDPGGPAAEVVNCRCTVVFLDEGGVEVGEGDADNPGDFEDSGTASVMPNETTRGLLSAQDKEDVVKPKRMRNARFNGQRSTTAQLATMTRRPSVVFADPPPAPPAPADDAAPEDAPDSRPDTPMKDNETVPDAPPEEWHALMVVEGVPTGDRRLIEQGALTWRDLPLPLMWQEQQPESGGHALAVHVGQITRIERQGDEIHAWGFLLHADPDGVRFDALLDEAKKLGVSVDMDDVDVEIDWPDEGDDGEGDPEFLLFPEPDLVRFTKARLMGMTSVPFPAFSEAFIEPINEDSETDTPPAPVPAPVPAPAASVLASIAPDLAPAEWFDDPRLDGPTPLTIDDNGRVYGHLAVWGTCHTSYQGMCVTPPASSSKYAYYRTGEVLCEGGERIAVGQLTLGAGHADKHASPQAALAHYDNVAAAVADVSCGEDVHGIWFAGALRPGATDEQVRQLRGAALSGDWRRIGGALELVAALAVNVPGFPVPRTEAVVAAGVQTALVAAGMIPVGWEPSDSARLERQAERIACTVGRGRADRVRELSDRVHRVGQFGCNCNKGRKVIAAGQQRTIRASASTARYQVIWPDGTRSTKETLLDARRASNEAGHGGRGVIKVVS